MNAFLFGFLNIESRPIAGANKYDFGIYAHAGVSALKRKRSNKFDDKPKVQADSSFVVDVER